MNYLNRLLFVAVMITSLFACNKANIDPIIKMEDLKVDAAFDWETGRDVEFQISADNATVVTITSEDGKIQYHKGFYSLLPAEYQATVNLPSYVQTVLVNGKSVSVTSSQVVVSLSENPQSMMKASINNEYVIPVDGLIAGWKFDENSGNIAHDMMGLHNGDITGSTWVTGISGSALEYDGLGGHVQVPNNSTFNPVGDKISFSFWFKLRQAGADGAFVFQNVKYMVRMDAQGRVSFGVYTPVFKGIVMAYTDRILNTDWHHVAATYDGAIMKIYVDGILKASGSNTGNLQSTTSPVYIGNQNSINPFKGTMDEVLIYSKALSETEITQIYTTTPNAGNGSSDLISSWSFNEGIGTVTTDNQGFSNGLITNATWGTGVSGGCLSFGGVTGNVKVVNAARLNPVNAITMMAWAKTNENKTAKIFEKGDWDGHGVGQDKWNGWFASIRLDNGTSQTVSWGGGVPIFNEWYHLAMTYDGTTLKMYVNGQLRDSRSIAGKLVVNSRDISVGSDNNAQKFFNGSIDEVKMFDKALSQTEIQTNFGEQGSPTDQDGDGVPDADDSYPNDPARAFINKYPAEGFGSLAFEDLWPGKGDYDFNDLVLDYQFNIVTNSANKVTEVLSNFAIRAVGAGYANGFGFQLNSDNILPADISVEGTVLDENYITLNTNGTEANQSKITVIVFDNVNKIMPPTSGFGVNVIPSSPYVDPDTVVINIGFTPNKYAISDLNLSNFNPFLIINKERGKEVHLPNYPPTSLVTASYFGSGQDNSDPSIGIYYKTANNLPWAIKIASSYDYTIESNQITNAFLKFASWAESSGVQFPDWYLPNSGYRNTASIYQVP